MPCIIRFVAITKGSDWRLKLGSNSIHSDARAPKNYDVITGHFSLTCDDFSIGLSLKTAPYSQGRIQTDGLGF